MSKTFYFVDNYYYFIYSYFILDILKFERYTVNIKIME